MSVRVLALPLLTFLVAACGPDQDQNVFEKAVSPDRAWVAQAVDEHDFGPGNAAHFIRVTLKSIGTASNSKPQDIIVLEPPDTEGYPGHPSSHIKLGWQSPTKLVVHYHDATADFAVARTGGVDIVTEAL